jgi:hypothetical protein
MGQMREMGQMGQMGKMEKIKTSWRMVNKVSRSTLTFVRVEQSIENIFP